MTTSIYCRDLLNWWFEVFDCRSGYSFVIGLLGQPGKTHAYVIRTPAVTNLDREGAELRTLFQDYRLGHELESVEDCAFLLGMFRDDPFKEPQVALFSTPYQSAKH